MSLVHSRMTKSDLCILAEKAVLLCSASQQAFTTCYRATTRARLLLNMPSVSLLQPEADRCGLQSTLKFKPASKYTERGKQRESERETNKQKKTKTNRQTARHTGTDTDRGKGRGPDGDMAREQRPRHRQRFREGHRESQTQP